MSKSFFCLTALLSLASLASLAGCATAADPTDTSDSGAPADTSVGDVALDTGDAPFDGPCVAPRKTCGGKCVDVTKDNANCGDCGKTCGETAACVAGVCTATGCGKDEVSCGGVCANLLSSHDHCGDCTTACKADEACIDAVCKLDCSKAPGTTDCGAVCADLKTDKNNCGTCLHACNPDQTCTAGVCKCPGTEVLCSSFGGPSTCTDTQTDNNNCGACGVFCDTFSGETCVKGACTCAPPKADCGTGTCIDLSSDDSNCGSCGHTCDTASSMHCHGSACVLDCGATGTDCGGVCKFLGSDPANCGACGNACAAGQYCAAGTCSCFAGLTNCSGVCEDLKSDGNNCGFCGRVCATGTVCSGGSCGSACGAGRTACGTSCIDTSSDDNNCGTCGHKCSGTTPFCTGGTCVSAPPCKTTGPYNVLFYGPTRYSGGGTCTFPPCSDETPYLPAGSTVTSADEATWRSMTTTDFSKYDLIIIGEGGVCPLATYYQAAFDTATVWAPAVAGRIVVTEHDPVFHAGVGNAGAKVFAQAVLQWAASGPGTGLYVAAECGARGLDFMTQFGPFGSLSSGGDTCHIVDPSHPTMIGSSDGSLSSWGSSFHGNISSFPPDFEEVEQGTDFSSSGFPITVVRNKTCGP